MKISIRIVRTLFVILSALVSGVSYGLPVIGVDSLRSDVELNNIPRYEVAIADSAAIADSIAFANKPWYKQLFANGFRIHDPRINYPAFPRFVLKIYDWGDQTFNSYDEEYVVGTGKNWKLTLNSYNWMESYMMSFHSDRFKNRLGIISDIHSDLGLNLSFMAVSIGYTAKVNNWFGDDSNRTNLNFNFTCSRFSANISALSTSGGARITHFGDYDIDGFNYKFDNIEHKALSGELYYFLNYKKYSQAAAYCYSKYQLKSAGSAIFGFAFNNQRVNLDFSDLPKDMVEYLPELKSSYRFRFADYSVIAGYGHNWALSPRRWLANLTLLPAVGYRHSYSESSEGRKDMLAVNLRMKFSFVYNHKALFASLNGRFDGDLFFNSKYTFFNSTESVSLIVGCRF